MSIDDVVSDSDRKKNRYHFDRHTPEYRSQFQKIEAGRIDFVDDLANIVPAVLTLAMLGIPLKKWAIYSEPVHASVYTPEHSPDIDRVVAGHRQMGLDLLTNMVEIKDNPRPGIVNGLLQLRID